MKYYSTRNRTKSVTFAQAVLSGLAPDGGLYVPEEIPRYPRSVLSSLKKMSFADIAIETIRPYVKGEIPDSALEEIVSSAYNFDVPIVSVGDRFVLELFHGPTAAFKDFGARFMARTFSFLRRGEDRPLKILVATSGDTGGAVADGFFGVEGITVTVLYPKGRVSPLQERQIAGLGGNIGAIAVEGSFDDCQRLVKAAFGNDTVRAKLDISSANSINIARLVPQAIYYTAASASPKLNGKRPLFFSVPSGNFGNLTAGVYAMKMGAPIKKFIAATNINKTFPDYLESGEYNTRISLATISNAMDVGAPSNFERLSAHWGLDKLRGFLFSTYVTDDSTRECIKDTFLKYSYALDPHGAVGWRAVDQLKAKGRASGENIAVLATAHPAKFSETVKPLIGEIPLPETLHKVMERTVNSTTIPPSNDALIELLV